MFKCSKEKAQEREPFSQGINPWIYTARNAVGAIATFHLLRPRICLPVCLFVAVCLPPKLNFSLWLSGKQ